VVTIPDTSDCLPTCVRRAEPAKALANETPAR